MLMPEIPFTYDSICRKIQEREQRGRRFSIVVVAEGARPQGADYVAQQSTVAGEAPWEASRGGGPRDRETNRQGVAVLRAGASPAGRFTHPVRSRVMLGVRRRAVSRIAENDFGKMVAYLGASVAAIPIKDR